MSSAAEHVVAVDGEMTIYRAAELKPLLLTPPAHAKAVALDLSRVSEVDTAGVQLVLLSQREALALSRTWRVAEASAAVHDAFSLLGLNALLPPTPAEAAA